MNKTVVIASSLATAGSIGGGVAYFFIDNNQKETPKPPIIEPKEIASFLADIKFEIPTKGAGNEKWNTQWGVFKKKYQNTTLPTAWEIEEWEKLKLEENAPDKFKDKCIANGKTKLSNNTEAIFEEVKTYCSIAKSV